MSHGDSFTYVLGVNHKRFMLRNTSKAEHDVELTKGFPKSKPMALEVEMLPEAIPWLLKFAPKSELKLPKLKIVNFSTVVIPYKKGKTFVGNAEAHRRSSELCLNAEAQNRGQQIPEVRAHLQRRNMITKFSCCPSSVCQNASMTSQR